MPSPARDTASQRYEEGAGRRAYIDIFFAFLRKISVTVPLPHGFFSRGNHRATGGMSAVISVITRRISTQRYTSPRGRLGYCRKTDDIARHRGHNGARPAPNATHAHTRHTSLLAPRVRKHIRSKKVPKVPWYWKKGEVPALLRALYVGCRSPDCVGSSALRCVVYYRHL